MSGDPGWDIRYLRDLLVRWRRFIFWNVGIVTGGALVLALVLPPWYTGVTTMLPLQDDSGGVSVSTMLRGLTIPRGEIPTQVRPGEVSVAILASRTLLSQLVDEFDLRRVYRRKTMEETIKELRRHIGTEIGEDGLIRLRVEDRERARAAAMANRMLELLDQFNRERRFSRGKRARIFIEQRIKQTQLDLAVAEDSLLAFQLTHKSLLLRPDESSSAELGAKLLSERIDLQMRLGIASTFASKSGPEMERLRLRGQELDRQIGKLPGLGIGMARLYRDVKVLEQVFTLLMAQYEEAKIEEARDIPTVEVLDRAIPPERKSHPIRSVIVLLGFAGSAMLAVGYVLAADYLRRVSHPA